MVFCGRPSRACERCRQRKLRCDHRKPVCTPCSRAEVACSGYRDVGQLRVRDETKTTQHKISKRSPVSTNPRSLQLSLKARAREAFMSNYVVGGTKTYAFLEAQYPTNSATEPLATSFDAVSLAYFSYQVDSPATLYQARKFYVAAIKQTHTALQQPDLATQDSTLAAAMLLDIYEKMTNYDPQHGGPWTTHANGALSLVGLRGRPQIDSRVGRAIISRLGVSLLISCVASYAPVPPELISLRALAAEFSDVEDPKWRLSDLMILYAQLQASVQNKSLSEEQIATSAVALDARYLELLATMPASWQCKVVSNVAEPRRTYESHYHCYKDRHVTQVTNVVRFVRILTNETIINHSQSSSTSLLACQIGTSAATPTTNIVRLAKEICASVPQYVDSSSSSSTADVRSGGAAQRTTPARLLDCYTLILPMYVAARSLVAPPSLKEWVIGELYLMADRFQIRNAAIVARILERGEERDPWTVYAMLGSYAFAA